MFRGTNFSFGMDMLFFILAVCAWFSARVQIFGYSSDERG